VTVLAHGVGTRADLPLPLSYAVVGGGLAVLVSFVALAVLWRTPRLNGRSGRALPEPLQRLLTAAWLRWLVQALALVAWVSVIVVGWFGPREVPDNLAPWALFVTFWVGLVVAALLIGPIWAWVNPLRTIARVINPVLPPSRRNLPERIGMWPAALSLLGFAWLELTVPDRSAPRTVALFLTVYTVVHVSGGLVYGPRWFEHADGFEVYSRLLGRLSFFSRRADGVVVLGSPLRSADAQPARPGLTAVVVVLIGSTAYDGLTRTSWWQTGPGFDTETQWLVPSLGLFTMVAIVAVAYTTAAAIAGRSGGYTNAANRFAHSLIPIAAGYAIAHYFSLFVLDGQTTYILASDPFDTGLNLFGTAGREIDYGVLTSRAIALVQLIAIVTGHVLGVVLAHDRALQVTVGADGRATATQLPMLILMVGLTMGALLLLLGG